MTTPDVAVAILCLVIFSILGIAFTPIAIWHGPKGGALIGWGNLVLFCTVRMSGMITQIIDPSSRWIVVIQYIGVAFFIVANAGIIYEARFYLFDVSQRAARHEVIEALWTGVTYLSVLGALSLLVPGAIGFQKEINPENIEATWNLCGMASVVILIVLGGTTVRAHMTLKAAAYDLNKQQEDALCLLSAVRLACLAYGVPLVSSVIFFFSKDLTISPVGRDWLGRIVLYLLPELIACMALIFTGWKARHIGKENSEVIEMR